MELFVSCPLETGSGRVSSGVIALRVDPSDIVGEVKSMIHERGGLCPEKQQLSFVGETLEDDRKLSSYKIGSNCLLEETSMWITVRIQSSKSILLSVDGKETVHSIRARIEQREKISESPVALLFNYRKLEVCKTLDESEILRRSQLYLKVPGPPGSVKLFVEIEGHKVINLYVKPSDTVEDLKYYVYERENISPDQQEIVFENRSLVNHQTLSSYSIQSQSTVYVKKLLILLKICDKRRPTEQFELEVPWNSSILSVKAKIQDHLKRVQPEEQKLEFEGKELRNELTLSDYCIKTGNKLQFRMSRLGITLTINYRRNEVLRLNVDANTTVYSLKQLIRYKTGILLDSQLLIWNSKVLKNAERLYQWSDCYYTMDMTLQLVEQPVQSYKLYILSEGKVTDIEVSSALPVLILEKIYLDRILIFNGKRLKTKHPDDSTSLGNYNIQRGHLMHAIDQRHRFRAVNICKAPDYDLDCKKISVNLDETVLSLKVRLWADFPGMHPPSQQRLTHNGLPMEGYQILDEFGLDLVVVSVPQQVQLLQCPDGTTITIGIHTTDLVIVLKHLIYKMTGTEPDKQLLYYKGNVMDDECTIESYKVGTDSLLQLCKPNCVHDFLRERVSSEGRQLLWKPYGVKITVPPGVIKDGAIMLRVYDGHSATCFEYPPEYTPHSSVYELSLSSSEQVPPGSVQVTLTKFTTVPPSSRLCLMTAPRDPFRWTSDLKPLFGFSELLECFEINLQEKRVECAIGAAGMYLCVAGTTKHLSSSAQPKSAHRDHSLQLEELCKRYELGDDEIDKEVSDKHILKIYPQLEKWKRVAAHLGLAQEDVEAIGSRARPDEELMRLYMFQEWKKRNKIDKTATYQVLLEALLECSCSNSAVKVCELLQVLKTI